MDNLPDFHFFALPIRHFQLTGDGDSKASRPDHTRIVKYHQASLKEVMMDIIKAVLADAIMLHKQQF
jgi:hypothetical protein